MGRAVRRGRDPPFDRPALLRGTVRRDDPERIFLLSFRAQPLAGCVRAYRAHVARKLDTIRFDSPLRVCF